MASACHYLGMDTMSTTMSPSPEYLAILCGRPMRDEALEAVKALVPTADRVTRYLAKDGSEWADVSFFAMRQAADGYRTKTECTETAVAMRKDALAALLAAGRDARRTTYGKDANGKPYTSKTRWAGTYTPRFDGIVTGVMVRLPK